LGAYRIPLETGLLIPSDMSRFRKLASLTQVVGFGLAKFWGRAKVTGGYLYRLS